jgi:hypothetical protein
VSLATQLLGQLSYYLVIQTFCAASPPPGNALGQHIAASTPLVLWYYAYQGSPDGCSFKTSESSLTPNTMRFVCDPQIDTAALRRHARKAGTQESCGPNASSNAPPEKSSRSLRGCPKEWLHASSPSRDRLKSGPAQSSAASVLPPGSLLTTAAGQPFREENKLSGRGSASRSALY